MICARLILLVNGPLSSKRYLNVWTPSLVELAWKSMPRNYCSALGIYLHWKKILSLWDRGVKSRSYDRKLTSASCTYFFLNRDCLKVNGKLYTVQLFILGIPFKKISTIAHLKATILKALQDFTERREKGRFMMEVCFIPFWFFYKKLKFAAHVLIFVQKSRWYRHWLLSREHKEQKFFT